MPSTSGKQHRFFEWIEHTPGAAKKAGVSKSVAHDFVQADIGRHFAQGGLASTDPSTFLTQMQDRAGIPDLDVSKYAVAPDDPSAQTSNWGMREDGTPKGQGFLGLLKRPDDGKVSSELSAGIDMDGKETLVPTMVPTLSQAELDYLMTHAPGHVPHAIIQKAAAHARARIQAGLSPFANPNENLSDRLGLTPKFAGARMPDVAKLLRMAASMHRDVENVRQSALSGLSPLPHGKGYAKGGEVKLGDREPTIEEDAPKPDKGDKGAPVDAGDYLDNVSAVLGKGLSDAAESTVNAPYAITDALARTIDNPAPLWHGLGVAGDILRHTVAHPLDALGSSAAALQGLAKRTGAALSPGSVGSFLRDPTAVGGVLAAALPAITPGGEARMVAGSVAPEIAMARAANPTIGGFATAFNSAISAHNALPVAEKVANSKAARAALADLGVKNLLAKNLKMLKSERGVEGGVPIQLTDGRGVETTGLSLAPAYEQGKFITCPNSQSCKAICLGKTSGGNFMFGGGSDLDELKGPRLAHFKNTQAMIKNPEAFAVRLNDEITAAKMQAQKRGNKLGVRLNVLSDIHPKVHEAIINAHPDVDFYDYTKNASTAIAPNHHYTYSSTGVSNPELGIVNPHQNWTGVHGKGGVRGRLDNGQNVAMAFSVKGHAGDEKLPNFVHDIESGNRYRVVDGDLHDYRPLDAQPPGSPGVIVGLRNKAQTTKGATASQQSNGFFVHHDPSRGDTVMIAPQGRGKILFTNDKTPAEVQ